MTPIVAARLARGWTRAELASAAGVSEPAIRRLEKPGGFRSAQPATVSAVCTALQTSPLALWPEIEAEHPLVRRRIALGLTRVEQARGLGVSTWLLARLEAGHRPDPPTRRRILSRIGLDLEQSAVYFPEGWSKPAAQSAQRLTSEGRSSTLADGD